MRTTKILQILGLTICLLLSLATLFEPSTNEGVKLSGVILLGILGGFSGKVGPVVGGKWKDIDYMRSYVIPSNPNTSGQQTVRTKFAKIVSFARQLLTNVLQPYWDPFYSNQSGFNAWISENYATLDGSNDLVASSKMTKGTLGEITVTTIEYDDGSGNTTASYTPALNGNGELTDQVSMVVYDKINELFYFNIAGETRNDGTILVNLPAGLTPTNLIGYVFASRGTGSSFVVSDSVGQVCVST